MTEESTFFLIGRDFTETEIDDIIETVEIFKSLSRNELAKTICHNLNWYTPAGNVKVASAVTLLEKLERFGLIELPEKQNVHHKTTKEVIVHTKRTDPPAQEITGRVNDFEPIEVVLIRDKENRDLWNEYIDRYHMLGYKRPFGARCRYFIVSKAKEKPVILGCLVFSSAAWAIIDRERYIGWNLEDRCRYLNGILNNSRFLIFPWVNVQNLASKALSLVSKRIIADWQEIYNYMPVLLETFVDDDDYLGTCYQAANWKFLGRSKGLGRRSKHSRDFQSTVKKIYVYPLVKNFRAYLTGNRPEWVVS